MLRSVAFAVAASLSVTAPALSAELSDGEIRALEVTQGSFVTFKVEGWPKDAKGVMVTVVGPKDYYAAIRMDEGVPAFDLAKHGDLADGFYSYEITGSTGEKVKAKEVFNNGRDGKGVDFEILSFALSGRLLVKGGVIHEFSTKPEEGSEKPVTGESDPDTDTGEKPEVGDGKGEGDDRGEDTDKG